MLLPDGLYIFIIYYFLPFFAVYICYELWHYVIAHSYTRTHGDVYVCSVNKCSTRQRVVWHGVAPRGWVVPKVNGCGGACGTQRDGIYSIYIRYINEKELYNRLIKHRLHYIFYAS